MTTPGESVPRYCPCSGECHAGDNPCSFDCFAHDAEVLTHPELFGLPHGSTER